MPDEDDDFEIHDATPEEEKFLMSVLAVRASDYGARVHEATKLLDQALVLSQSYTVNTRVQALIERAHSALTVK